MFLFFLERERGPAAAEYLAAQQEALSTTQSKGEFNSYDAKELNKSL